MLENPGAPNPGLPGSACAGPRLASSEVLPLFFV